MKICIVNLQSLPVLAPGFEHERVGGEEIQAPLIAQALARRGHDVALVVGDYGQADGARYSGVKTLKAFRERAGIPILRYAYPRWTKLWRALVRADAQVYYVSCAGMMVGLTAMFCRKHGRGLVFRAASDSDCDPGKLLVRYWRDRKLYEHGLRRADAVLVQSAFQQESMRQNYRIDSEPARMLVDRPDGQVDDARKDIDLLWVANLRHVKRPDRVLDLAARLPHLRIHMAGGEFPGESALYARIAEVARQRPNITFHGQVTYRNIGALFDRAKIFINTSELEGFPNTLLQAWIRGLPVVTTFDPDKTVTREGLGIRVSDPAEMATAASRILGDPVEFEALRQRCLAHMATHYDEEALLQPYIRAMETAIAAASRRRAV